MLHHAGCPSDITLYLISLKMNLNIPSNINIKWYPLDNSDLWIVRLIQFIKGLLGQSLYEGR